MSGKERLLNFVTVLSAACAVTVTSIVVYRQIHPPSPSSDDPRRTNRVISDWEAQASLGHQMGPETAPLTILYFGDFECPACRGFARMVDEYRAQHPEDLRVVFRHFPLPYHRFAYPGARAAECAAVQGRFEATYRALYQAQDSLGLVPFREIARRAQVADLPRFDQCMSDSARVAVVERDKQAALAANLPGTPAVILNGTLFLERAVTEADLDEAVREARRSRGGR